MRISKSFVFHAAHHLPNVPAGHKCAAVHGHTYQAEVFVEGRVLEPQGWVMDYGDIKAAWEKVGGDLDHSDLNARFDNPTAENLARYLGVALSGFINQEDDFEGTRVVAVVVRETPQTSATWSAWEEVDW